MSHTLQALVNSLEKKNDETEKKFEESFKLSFSGNEVTSHIFNIFHNFTSFFFNREYIWYKTRTALICLNITTGLA